MFNCLQDFLDYHARVNTDVVFANDATDRFTYGEALKRANRIAQRLYAMQINQGDRVALLARNSAQLLVTYLACCKLGAVPVGINYRLAPGEIGYIINNAEAKCVFCDVEHVAGLHQSGLKVPMISLRGSHENAEDIEEWLTQPGTVFEPPNIDTNDVLHQMYTSGTTGLPKGVLLSHFNVISNAFQTTMASGYTFRPGESMLLVAPMYHAAGLMTALVALIQGLTLVIHRDYDPARVVATLKDQPIVAVTLVPAMIQFILNNVEGIEHTRFPDLKLIYYGAAPMSVSLLNRAINVFNCDFCQGFGQTENNSVLTILSPRDHHYALSHNPELLNSCGRPVFKSRIRIVDDQHNEVPIGTAGEITAKGPQVMRGYWKNEEATRNALINGWLHTGDVGRLDEMGFLYILDRKKDMIISGAENIYPVEIEKVLLAHPAIADAAVIGVPNEKWGEVPIAILVPAGNAIPDESELKSYCKNHLASFKVPTSFKCVEEIPRNPSGKILKQNLRKQFIGHQ